jgi:2-succinyl-5-enolpyruvyl-6-hydroxy-3-cyclohexene-1-carboxylate synthase
MKQPFAVAVIEAVLAGGVQEFVVCAGARNSALIVVIAALGDKVRLWQHFDERAAGFFALGRIRATSRPVAVITTSGTAAAELLPAVIEAHYQGLPLLAVTADRPRHYRRTGAPQAIEQAGLFQDYTVQSLDLEDGKASIPAIDFATPDKRMQLPGFSTGAPQGPVQVNFCTAEPGAGEMERLRETAGTLTPEGTGFRSPAFGFHLFPPGQDKPCEYPPVSAHRVMIAGELLGEEIAGGAAFAPVSGGLVYAEAASGLRDCPALQDRLIKCGEATLKHLPLRCVARFGGVPSLRFWRDLEERPEIQVANQSRAGFPGLARQEGVMEFSGFWLRPVQGNEGHPMVRGDVVPPGDFLARDAALYARLGELLARFPNSEPALFRRLSQVIPQETEILTGNSLAIREWNLCAEYGRGHRVHVLRGANGIDGNLSAFLGIAADVPEAWCVTGDLTTLYDLNAPWMLRQLPAGHRRFVVIQNAGGKIFSRLPSLRGLTDRERALMENPHTVSLRGWAEMWGMDHASGGREILEQVQALADHAVIELYPDAAETEEFWKAWAQAEAEVWGPTH